MIKYKIQIGALIFRAHYGDVLFLEKLLSVCDTSKLTFVRALCNLCNMSSASGVNRMSRISSYRSEWISEAYTYLEGGGIVDLCDDSEWVTLQDMSRALGVPYSCSRPRLRQLHDAIGCHCENLSELEVNLDIPHNALSTDLRDYLSEMLFSPDRKYKLHLHLSLDSGISKVLDVLLGNLVNLQELSISCRGTDSPRRIRLVSKSLISLDATGIRKNTFISGDLPNLKTLMYNGFCNGIVPQFRVDREGREIDRRYDGHVRRVFLAGDARIHCLNVPRECEIIQMEIYSESGDARDPPPWMLESFLFAPLC
jgi:hypothetical protein